MKVLIDNLKVSTKNQSRLGSDSKSPYHNSRIELNLNPTFAGNSGLQAIIFGDIADGTNWFQDPTTGVFTVPESGTYVFAGSVMLDSGPQTWSYNHFFQSYIVVNGEVRLKGRLDITDTLTGAVHNAFKQSSVSGLVELEAGDSVIFSARSNNPTTHNLYDSQNYYNWLTIGRIL